MKNVFLLQRFSFTRKIRYVVVALIVLTDFGVAWADATNDFINAVDNFTYAVELEFAEMIKETVAYEDIYVLVNTGFFGAKNFKFLVKAKNIIKEIEKKNYSKCVIKEQNALYKISNEAHWRGDKKRADEIIDYAKYLCRKNAFWSEVKKIKARGGAVEGIPQHYIKNVKE